MNVGKQGLEGFSFLAQNPRKGRRLDCPWIKETKWGLKEHKKGRRLAVSTAAYWGHASLPYKNS